jgi:hypothetical protein
MIDEFVLRMLTGVPWGLEMMSKDQCWPRPLRQPNNSPVCAKVCIDIAIAYFWGIANGVGKSANPKEFSDILTIASTWKDFSKTLGIPVLDERAKEWTYIGWPSSKGLTCPLEEGYKRYLVNEFRECGMNDANKFFFNGKGNPDFNFLTHGLVHQFLEGLSPDGAMKDAGIERKGVMFQKEFFKLFLETSKTVKAKDTANFKQSWWGESKFWSFQFYPNINNFLSAFPAHQTGAYSVFCVLNLNFVDTKRGKGGQIIPTGGHAMVVTGPSKQNGRITIYNPFMSHTLPFLFFLTDTVFPVNFGGATAASAVLAGVNRIFNPLFPGDKILSISAMAIWPTEPLNK